MKRRLFLSAVAVGLALLGAPAMAGEDSRSQLLKSGEIRGLNDHRMSGTVSILRTPGGDIAVLSDDFSLDRAPDPQLAFGNRKPGSERGYDKRTLFAKLKSKSGTQSYAIPANIDPTLYDEFYVWCPSLYVGLGVASLK